jgi:hypothetical protein
METQFFLVGYDRETGFARAIHAIPRESVDAARALAGMAPDSPADWPLSTAIARQIAALSGTEIDTDGLEFCLEPHQDLEAAGASNETAEAATNPK